MMRVGQGRSIDGGDALPPERLIAYVEILGLTHRIQSAGGPGDLRALLVGPSIFAKQKRLYARQSRSSYNPTVKDFSDVRMSHFADSAVISNLHPDDKWAVDLVLGIVGSITSQLLVEGFATSGAISRGWLVHDDNVVFGGGLSTAVESAFRAQSPRILVDPNVFEKASDIGLTSLVPDRDGKMHVDIFAAPTFLRTIRGGRVVADRSKLGKARSAIVGMMASEATRSSIDQYRRVAELARDFNRHVGRVQLSRPDARVHEIPLD